MQLKHCNYVAFSRFHGTDVNNLGSVIKVYFDENTVDYLNDSNAISAIGKLLYSLNNGDMQNYPTIEIPLITNVTYVSENNLSILAEEYFQNNNLTEFSAIFPVLDTELQKEYCQKIYDENRSAFFSAILSYIQSDERNQYAEKCYEANNISYFTILVDYMTKEERQEWIKRAQTDKKTNFVAVLSD